MTQSDKGHLTNAELADETCEQKLLRWIASSSEWERRATIAEAALRQCQSSDKVLVPREPTEAMLDVLEQGPALLHDSESWQDYQRRQWALVLAAAEGHHE